MPNLLETLNAFNLSREASALDSHLHHRDSLAEHDRKYHGGLFTGGRCRFRSVGDQPDILCPRNPPPAKLPQDEFNAVLLRYKDSPLWMKAPNGNPTRLTEYQWVLVRTPSFRMWFGDWLRKYYTRCWKDVVDPSAIESIVPVDVSGFARLADRNAVADAFASFGVVKNRFDGREVRFPSNVAGRFVYVRNYALAFKRLFESARRAWSENEITFAGHKAHRNIVAYHHYINKLKTSDGVRFVRFTVREGRQGAAEGENHVHAATISSVGMYKKGATHSDTLDRDVTPCLDENAKASYLDYKIANYLDRVNEESVSKVIDENGEPMVVHHGTKDRFDVFTGGDENNSSWFAEKIGYAREYAGDPEDGDVDAWVKHCFLNVRKPFDMREGENVVDGYAEISRTRHDGGEASDAEIAKMAKLLGTTVDDIRSRFDNRQIWEITQSREFAEHLRSLGYDGIKFIECGDPTWATFDPGQVRAATDDEGRGAIREKSTSDEAGTAIGRYLEACTRDELPGEHARKCHGGVAHAKTHGCGKREKKSGKTPAGPSADAGTAVRIRPFVCLASRRGIQPRRASMFNAGDFKSYLKAGRCREDMTGVPIVRSAVLDEDEKALAKTFLRVTLAEHDKRFHKGGYRDGDVCNFRAALKRGDSADELAAAEKKEGDVKVGFVRYKEDGKTGRKEVVGIEEVRKVEVDGDDGETVKVAGLQERKGEPADQSETSREIAVRRYLSSGGN